MNVQHFNFVTCSTGECNDYPKEITVRIDGESQPILIIPFEEEPEPEPGPVIADYVNVRIQVEPENLSIKTEDVVRRKDVKIRATKSKERTFVCDLCSKAFATRQHLERHNNLHSKKTLYPCEECDKVLLDRSYLLRHMKIHIGVRRFKCRTCEKAFLTPSSLRRHETLHNPDLRSHVCSQCGKRFPDNSSLQKHSHLHTGVKKHVCPVCGHGFSHLGDYNIHMKCHDPVKEYQCDDCGRRFARHNNMVRHRAVHSGEGSHSCDTCNVSFQHAGTLTRHILSCHPEKAKVKKSVVHPPSVAPEVLAEEDVDGDLDMLDSKIEVDRINSKENEETGLSQQITLIRSSPSSFQIFRLNDVGVLERIAENVSVEVLCSGEQNSSDTIQVNDSNEADTVLLEA
ncbi:zinc finger protein OZF-like [Thrips palmi]|uniref:Zinc finger protein OZF-like n=1 Tax=Thrips palmi TaxID=161013 RepID=A0A6P9ABX6_THRPL|nr:zinc finger protein OZF-like [Thrips palmi]